MSKKVTKNLTKNSILSIIVLLKFYLVINSFGKQMIKYRKDIANHWTKS